MPTHIEKQYSREKVDAYHKAIIDLINLVRRWPKNDVELQEFLEEQDWGQPPRQEYVEFCSALDTVLETGEAAGIQYLNLLADQKRKLLALRLYGNEKRRFYYARFINNRLNCASTEAIEPLSLVELEERYQHYLYSRARKKQGLGCGPVFKTWRETLDCHTFYDN